MAEMGHEQRNIGKLKKLEKENTLLSVSRKNAILLTP
jgi:hypothetical protein